MACISSHLPLHIMSPMARIMSPRRFKSYIGSSRPWIPTSALKADAHTPQNTRKTSPSPAKTLEKLPLKCLRAMRYHSLVRQHPKQPTSWSKLMQQHGTAPRLYLKVAPTHNNQLVPSLPKCTKHRSKLLLQLSRTRSPHSPREMGRSQDPPLFLTRTHALRTPETRLFIPCSLNHKTARQLFVAWALLLSEPPPSTSATSGISGSTKPET